MISEECAKAADVMAERRAKVDNLETNGHKEIAQGVRSMMVRDAEHMHAQCLGCDCQCQFPEVRS